MRDGSWISRSICIVSAMTRPRFSQCAMADGVPLGVGLLREGDGEVGERPLVALGVDERGEQAPRLGRDATSRRASGSRRTSPTIRRRSAYSRRNWRSRKG